MKAIASKSSKFSLDRESELDRLDLGLRQAIAIDLAPQVNAIDRGSYPTAFMHRIGELGAFAQATAKEWGGTGKGILPTLRGIEAVSEVCMSTGFVAWCQNACAWYIQNSENSYLHQELLPKVSSAEQLAGTGLSNSMKHFAGIEKITLSAKSVSDGYILNGMLPWVSNIDRDHVFAIAAKLENAEGYLMAVVDGSWQGLILRQDAEFIALEGTKTFKCIFRDVFVPTNWILANDAESDRPCNLYIQTIRPGFILAQVGMGLGIVRSCIDLIRREDRRKGHVNQFLADGVEQLEEDLVQLQLQSYGLAKIVQCGRKIESKEVLVSVIQARIGASELALRASQSAMLHAGAIAYVKGSDFERKLRESYFVAIVTPAIKHLKKMLAEIP
jgi:alkylation response protein AidB-like acyl-CoA dehydrogenase